jgi:hypothetical protein
MPVETLTALPCEIRAGTTVRFTMSFTEYPASAWSLSFSLLGQASLSAQGVASGDAFTVVLTAAQTATLTPGQYNWAAKVTETASGDVAIADQGFAVILPDLSNTAVGPWRTRYNAAVAAMAGISGSQFASVDVEGQSFTTHNVVSLQSVIDRLEMKAIEEDKLLGRSTSGNTKKIVYYI